MKQLPGKSLELSFRKREDIPPLAWCLEARRGSGTAIVWHGVRVETTARAFVDGAWDGDYAGMAMDSGVCMGSGGRIRADGLVLVTASHTHEPLYSARLGDSLVASNSLPFTLSRAGLQLDPHYRRYLIDFRSIKQGVRRYVSAIPTLQNIPVERHFFCNLVVDEKLQLRREPKPLPPRFQSFEAYRNHLEACLGRLTQNANDSARSFTYPLLATVSRGYDSPACAALAAACGCRQAVTIVNASFGATSDDGTEIGESLSMEVMPFQGQDFRAKPGMPEAEFVALGDAGDIIYSNFEDVLRGRMLVTGIHGDTVWNPHCRHVGPDIRRVGAGGTSLAEFRLRVGFVHVPLPFIGCQNHADINAIGRSAEMDPWRIGGSYDRPVARRIAEEAGVARHVFGQKKAYAAVWWTMSQPKPESKESYEGFRRMHRDRADRFADMVHVPLHRIARLWFRAGGFTSRVLRKAGVNVRIPQIVSGRFTESPREAQLVQWGISIVRRRYEFDAAEPAVGGALAGTRGDRSMAGVRSEA